MSLAVELRRVSHLYSEKTPFEKTAIKDVTLSIEAGAFVGVIGHTGSGKTTLIQHLNGLLKPSSGQVLIHGRDIWAEKTNIRDVRFEVGLVFQYPEYQLFEETVYRDIAYGPTNMGLSPEEVRARVERAAGFAGVSERLFEKSPFELSGGQKRRVAIAGVIAMQPKILILDEPAAGLDPKGRESVLKRIQAYHKEEKNTVLLVSHSMEDVARFSDKILVMNQGEVWRYDTPAAIFAQADLLGRMGLGVPQITNVFAELNRRGASLDPSVFTTAQAVRELLAALGKERV